MNVYSWFKIQPMKNTLKLFAVFILLTCVFNSCKKTETKGIDAIIGTYNFTNTYSLYQWNNNLQKVDTTNATETYVITIEAGVLGANNVAINGMLRQAQTEQVDATLSAAGDVLVTTDGNFESFQGLVNGGTINLTYRAYGNNPNGVSEVGSGTAVKR